MAADLSSETNAATIIQASVRGFLLRQQLKCVQREFESIVSEIEGPETHILWPVYAIGLPVLVTDDRDLGSYLASGKYVRLSESADLILEDSLDNERTLIPDNDCNRLPSNIGSTENSNTEIQLQRELFPEKGRTTPKQSLQTDHEDLEQDTDVGDTSKTKDQRNMAPVPTTPKKISPISSPPSKSPSDNGEPCINRPVLSHEDFGGKPPNAVGNPIHLSGRHSSHSVSPVGSFSPAQGQFSTPAVSDNSEPSSARAHALKSHPLLTDSWMTDKSFDPAPDSDSSSQVITDDLQKTREQIAMELLWTQQAIQSRKNYLRLKKQMEEDTGHTKDQARTRKH
ncbi:uncharacterized protein LOC116601121 [Nematostella vectensis]|uniref:uncharacterized protein LOC116601121 n=1 Tax=Nematostella vectensis TaxID=45351 RepID=UPI0020777D10|nr:uncharacterized protein LOC116601121 [Nematostella vectensis]